MLSFLICLLSQSIVPIHCGGCHASMPSDRIASLSSTCLHHQLLLQVWAVPPKEMQCEWLGERVATVDVDRAIRNVIHNKEDAGWGPNAVFRFPLEGGTGGIWKGVAKLLPQDKQVSLPASALLHQPCRVWCCQHTYVSVLASCIGSCRCLLHVELFSFVTCNSCYTWHCKCTDKSVSGL